MDANERRERASREAAEWWQALEAGELSRAARERYVDWLRESSVHVAEMLRTARVHNALAQFERWAGIETEDAGEDVVVAFPENAGRESVVTKASATGSASVEKSPGSGRWMKVLALAAGLSGVAIAAGWLWLATGGQVIETVRGERREVALGDGSVVQVDPETRLTVRLEEQRRQVTLERGRALFRVAKDPERPFMVQADGTIVRAIGTAFGVERRGGEVTVTVAEGKVAVLSGVTPRGPLRPEPVEQGGRAEHRQDAGTGAEPQGLPAEPAEPAQAIDARRGIFLVANEQVTVGGSGSAEAVRQVDSGKELAWAEGRLVFEDDTVADVIRDFNRYNLVQLHVSDEELARRTVSGVFDASDPESFIAFMQTVTEIKVVRGNGQEITIASQ